MFDQKNDRIGIIAGQGHLPAQLIEACQSLGCFYFVLAFEDQTDPIVVENIPHAWNRLGAIGKSIQLFKEQGINTLVMAGGIKRPSWLALRPDFKAAQVLTKIGNQAFGDDGLLKAIIQLLEKEGFRVIGAHELLNELSCPAGNIGTIVPTEQEHEDLIRGFKVAKALGTVDVGQAAVVHQGIVLAVEAVEGTDHMLLRIPLARSRIDGLSEGGVLVKASKPDQEERVDLPSIGKATILNAVKAGLRGIGLESKKCLIINKNEVVKCADEQGLFIYGLD